MGGRCSEKVDIFSYGVVLWELVTGESPVRGRLRPVRCGPRRSCPCSVSVTLRLQHLSCRPTVCRVTGATAILCWVVGLCTLPPPPFVA